MPLSSEAVVTFATGHSIILSNGSVRDAAQKIQEAIDYG